MKDTLSKCVGVVPHVRWGLNRRNELQSSVAHTDYANDSAWHNAEPALTDNDGADEDVEDAAAEEREHEGGIACHLLGNLELEESSSCCLSAACGCVRMLNLTKTEYDQVYTEDDVRAAQTVSAFLGHLMWLCASLAIFGWHDWWCNSSPYDARASSRMRTFACMVFKPAAGSDTYGLG